MRAEVADRNRRKLGRLALWLGVVLVAIAFLRSVSIVDDDQSDPNATSGDGSVMRSIRVKTVDTQPVVDVHGPDVERAILALRAGETASISTRDLSSEHPLTLDLILPADRPSAGEQPARIVSQDESRALALSGVVFATDRGRVRIQIDSAWLLPGAYQIELESPERSELDARPYLLEAR